MKKLTENVRNQDMFGHTITLNFNRDSKSYQEEIGNSYQTLCGGFFSWCIKAFLIFYISMRFKILVLGDDPYVVKITKSNDLSKNPPIFYNETDIIFFWVIRK